MQLPAAVQRQGLLAYLGLADRIASRYRHSRGTTLEDLTQTARAGLIAAIDRYDPAKGPGFVPFAVASVVGEIKRDLRDTGWRLHVPRPRKEQVLDGYRATHPRPQDRLAFLQWPREIPFDGQPADVAEAIHGYLAWIGQTDTPMLYVYGDPGAINDDSTRRWAQTTITNLDTARIDHAAHFIPEDQPDALGRVLADWLSRLSGGP